jgi:cellulose synthase/poly-beta-1,6-N-acetylglucosamine synthase-like glycosyltransferase
MSFSGAMEIVFWVSVAGIVYPYLAYPLLLWLWGALRPRPDRAGPTVELPTVSMIVPVHNEAKRLGRKIENTAALQFPADRLEILFVSDGSTDGTVETLRSCTIPGTTVIERPERAGKAAALNAGLERARHDILVFTDAAIELEPDALTQILRRFQEPEIGCVSGEDSIPEGGGESWYGRYELMLRRLESRVHSIVGASGSFYAQRRALCQPFLEGMAPDFLSVLRTVEQGYRAVTEPSAVGTMTSLKNPRQEFDRKVRTLIRGMTTLFANPAVLNPARHGAFAFSIWSHKLMRWLAPFFMVLALVTPVVLLDRPFYMAVLVAQIAFYAVAVCALPERSPLHHWLIGKLALYFTNVNAAVLAAWLRYIGGVRQEIWTPSRRA